ncbi:unnamed protein product [Victoria cruziana]
MYLVMAVVTGGGFICPVHYVVCVLCFGRGKGQPGSSSRGSSSEASSVNLLILEKEENKGSSSPGPVVSRLISYQRNPSAREDAQPEVF